MEFHQTLQHIHICKINTFNKNVRGRGQLCELLTNAIHYDFVFLISERVIDGISLNLANTFVFARHILSIKMYGIGGQFHYS